MEPREEIETGEQGTEIVEEAADYAEETEPEHLYIEWAGYI